MTPVIIQEKPVYVVKNHAHAFKAWAAIKKITGFKPLLITFDHHTDTRLAFIKYICNTYGDKYTVPDHRTIIGLSSQYIAKFNINGEEIIKEFSENLSNDEQIDAAIKCDLLSYAFVFQNGGCNQCTHSREEITYSEKYLNGFCNWKTSRPAALNPLTKKLTYNIPENNIFIIPSDCSCKKTCHDDECQRSTYDICIDDDWLESRLFIANSMADSSINIKDIIKENYILDIDLDYFHTVQSIDPQKLSIFYKLILNSIAISIATEPSCVELCKLEGEPINSDNLLAKLCQHIRLALS